MDRSTERRKEMQKSGVQNVGKGRCTLMYRRKEVHMEERKYIWMEGNAE